jgi:hypothetical protein
MQTAELVSRVEVSARKVWNAWFFDEEFQDGLFKVFRIVCEDVNVEAEGEWPKLKVERTLYFDTDRDIPKALLKIVRGMTRVHETLRFDASERKMEVSLRVPVIGKLVDYGYVYRWEELGDDTMEINWKGHCGVRIPLIRRMAESYLLGELEGATRDGARYVAEFFGAPEPVAD